MSNQIESSNKSIKKFYAFDDKHVDSEITYSDDFAPRSLDKDLLTIGALLIIILSIFHFKK